MPRKRKQDVKVNDSDSLQGLMQEIYNDACLQITEAQTAITLLSVSTDPQDVDDHTKIAKEKANLLKIKDLGISKKLEVAKLQTILIKSNSDADSINKELSANKASIDDFKAVREMFKKRRDEDYNDNE